jgi:predicted AAA+ superfamily ATPase
MQEIIERPQYLNALLSWQDKADIIKVITGIRRCGKSTMFKIFQKNLSDNGVSQSQIQAINFEDANFSDLLDWKKLHDHVQSNLVPEKMNYIFLDEIQNVPDFERAVNSLRLRDNVNLYITGSNSKILSGELATLLSGRYVTIHMQPLSFKEYVSAYPFAAAAKEEMFWDYLHNSSFPYAMQMTGANSKLLAPDTRWDKEQIRMFLKGLFDTIVLKDVVERKNVKNVLRLNNVIKFMFENIGSETSVRNIKNVLESDNGIKIDVNTIESYLDGLMDAFVLYKIGRYDIKGKQHLKTNAKYYAADIGLRYLLLGREGDAGHILENIIFLELLRRGYDINIGKIGNMEVDFVATKNGSVEYYQVAHEIGGKTTHERELRSLDMIQDHNPKFLLTMDRFFTEEHKGIKTVNAVEWLLDGGRLP